MEDSIDKYNPAIVMPIDLLYKSLEKYNLLIVGSPKGVGFTSYMCMWVAYKLFFNDNFKCVIWCNNPAEKVKILNKIAEEYKYYHKSLIVDGSFGIAQRDKDPDGKLLSAVFVEDYHNFDANYENKDLDLVIIDKDNASEALYTNIDVMGQNCKQMIINTYDTPESIIYNINAPKVLIKSKYSQRNIAQLKNIERVQINYERIVWGEFNDLPQIYYNMI